MTTTTSLGPNSAQIYYTPSDTITGLYDAIGAVMTSSGWTLFDAAAGANSARVYRAVCVDNVTYKYVRLELVSNYIYLGLYESWDAVTHTGPNSANFSDSTSTGPSTNYAQRFDLSGSGYVYVFATARYICLLSKYGGTNTIGDFEYGTATGVFEVARDNSADVASEDAFNGPPVIWTNMGMALGRGIGTTYYTTFTVPRRYAQTGTPASYHGSIGTIFGRSLPANNTATQVTLASLIPNTLASNKNYVFTPYVTTASSRPYSYGSPIRGRMYGLKIITRNQGMSMDTIAVKVDSSLFADATAGSTATHYVLADKFDGRFIIPA